MWSPHKPQHQLKPIQYWRRNLFFPSHKIYVCLNVPGLALPLLLSPATIMGDRGSEYRAVAREELEVFEMKVKLKDGFVWEVTFRREERRGTILWSWRRRWPCWTVVGLFFIKHNIFHKRLHGHCWIHHWQRNLRVSKWCAEGEFRCCSNIKIDSNPTIPHLFPEHGKREHGFVGLDLLRPLLADRSLLLCRAGLHDQEVRWSRFLFSQWHFYRSRLRLHHGCSWKISCIHQVALLPLSLSTISPGCGWSASSSCRQPLPSLPSPSPSMLSSPSSPSAPLPTSP